MEKVKLNETHMKAMLAGLLGSDDGCVTPVPAVQVVYWHPESYLFTIKAYGIDYEKEDTFAETLVKNGEHQCVKFKCLACRSGLIGQDNPLCSKCKASCK